MRNAPTSNRRRPPARSRRLAIDPYLVSTTTWTREELLRARGDEPARRRSSKPATKAA